MRPELQHVAVLDRSGLALVRVDDDKRGPGSRETASHLIPVGKPAPAVPGESRRLELLDDALGARAASEELETAARLVVRERLVPLCEPERRAVVRRVRDLGDDLVAARHDGREVAVAEACDLDRSRACSRGARVAP